MAWDDILEQAFAKQIWQSHLAAGRVASAYLLAGPAGVGKRLLAGEMAKALLCAAEDHRPCDACLVCSQVSRRTHPDIHAVIPGGVSSQISIEEIRHLIGRVALRPYSAQVQVAILDGAERLTEEAANSFLKVLEEPPTHTRFILLTAKLSHCLPTVRSRCQLIRCQPLSPGAIARILTQRHACDVSQADAIARLARGSAARALELAERWAFHDVLDRQLATGTPEAWVSQPLPEGRQDVAQWLDGMAQWLRDVAVTAVAPERPTLYPAHADALRRQAASVDPDQCLETAVALVRLRESLDQFASPKLVATLAREYWLSLTTLER